MKLSLVCVLLMSALLATSTEASWVKKTLGKVGSFTKHVVTQEAVKGLTGIVKQYGPTLATGVIGKRSVNLKSMVGQAGSALAKNMVKELDLACTQFRNLRGKQGLNADDLKVALRVTDGNKDGNLNGPELDLFENTVEAVQHCLGLLKREQTM